MHTIKQSNIPNAGYGVFTTTKYNKGEYICFYDCYRGNIKNIDEFIYSIKNPFTNENYIGCKKIKHKDGIGQYINDSHMFELIDEYRDIENGCFKESNYTLNLAINNYKSKSIEKSNCIFSSNEEDVFKIYASKDIDVNEELYLHYGIQYWICKIQFETDEPLTRLFCYIMNDIISINNNNIYFDNKKIKPIKLFELLKIQPNGNLINACNIHNLSDLNKIKFLIELCK